MFLFFWIKNCNRLHTQLNHVKDTNDFLKNLHFLPKLPKGIILCTMDIVQLYPNILQNAAVCSYQQVGLSKGKNVGLSKGLLNRNEGLLLEPNLHLRTL